MAAKDWAPLRDALWRHVREPLLRDHTDAWNGIKPGDTIPFEHRRQLANNGRISATDNKAAVLWYTLVYGCLHYDALSALMGRQEFKGLVHGALNRPSKPHSRSIPHSFPDRSSDRPTVPPCLLHVDVGCGPGTAAWAVIENLRDQGVVTTIGHDHNSSMIALAQKITADISKSLDDPVDCNFYSDWIAFEKKVKWSWSLEPISKSFKQYQQGCELHKAQEVVRIVLPARHNAALPLEPGEKALDLPPPRVAT